jgi:potassium/chloride transporter 4/5/6
MLAGSVNRREDPETPEAVHSASGEKMLAQFVERHGLDADAAFELKEIFETASSMARDEGTGPKENQVTYQWDQIHELIMAHSPNTSLVIVNLPDPPELSAAANLNPSEQMAELRDYMNYMDGVAENLPRVMYVHGSGQEIINFDRME